MYDWNSTEIMLIGDDSRHSPRFRQKLNRDDRVHIESTKLKKKQIQKKCSAFKPKSLFRCADNSSGFALIPWILTYILGGLSTRSRQSNDQRSLIVALHRTRTIMRNRLIIIDIKVYGVCGPWLRKSSDIQLISQQQTRKHNTRCAIKRSPNENQNIFEYYTSITTTRISFFLLSSFQRVEMKKKKKL